MKHIPALTLCLAVLTSPVMAEDSAPADKAAPATYFAASKAFTLQGKIEAADEYSQSDFNRFVAGNGIVISQVDNNYSEGANVTLKGIACFDLEQGNMRETLTHPGDQQLLASFILQQIKGKPRPLRVEYVGTFKDITQEESFQRIFQAQEIYAVNEAAEQGSSNGLKTVDLTEVTTESLPDRWLVIRFEQQGLRIENTGEGDLYQFHDSADAVRLTLTDKNAAGKTVAQHYTASGYYNLEPDLSTNLVPDMSNNIDSDEPSNLTADEPSNLTPDMSSNLVPDMSNNLIDDGNSN